MSWAEFVEAFQPVRPTSDDRVDLTALHMRCSAARQEESHDTELRRDREADPGRARAPPLPDRAGDHDHRRAPESGRARARRDQPALQPPRELQRTAAEADQLLTRYELLNDQLGMLTTAASEAAAPGAPPRQTASPRRCDHRKASH